MSNDSQRSEAQAAQLVELLNEVYRGYMESSRSQEKSFRGIARLFRRWISFNPAVDEPLHQKFVDDVEGIIAELAHALDALGQKDPALCNLYAAKAADLILAPKPGREKTTAEWYMTIAEYKCAAILPYLATDVLRRIRDAQLKATPKRMMYPRQRELFDYIEKLLANRK
jgi:hypothetical protein